MATGRTNTRSVRCYADGYDLSGDARSVGPLAVTYPDGGVAGFSSGVIGTLPGIPTVNIGTLNAIFNSATGGSHATIVTADTARDIMIPVGIRAAPAAGDPVFAGTFIQKDYQLDSGGDTPYTVSIPWGTWDISQSMNYTKFWGHMIHALGAETGANSAAGVESPTGAATTVGAWMQWQITAVEGTGTVQITAEGSATSGGVYSAITGLDSTALAHTAVPSAGYAQTAVTETIAKYVRFQVALTGITSVTFALALFRG